MKKALAIIISLLICTLCACTPGGSPPGTAATEQTQPPTESTAVSTTAAPTTEVATEEQTTQPSETEGTHPQSINEAASAPTRQTESTEPLPTQSTPTETQSSETQPPAAEAPTTEPPQQETEPPTTDSTEATAATEETQPETEPEVFEPSYEFKRQVASYAAQYINQYRSSPCTVLSGMSQVAQYRAGQLCYNFSHSTADKRAALAYYEYGRWIDATLAGLDESDSYYESDTSEAICRGFKGADAEALGRSLADAIHNSGSHWAYVGSSEFSFMGIGVEYHDGKWYACVMVGTVNYG